MDPNEFDRMDGFVRNIQMLTYMQHEGTIESDDDKKVIGNAVSKLLKGMEIEAGKLQGDK